MNFGINLSFAVKRWVEPPVWAKLVRETLGLELVQFTYDLLDPWWPDASRHSMAAEVRKAASDWGIQIESAFSGLANYCFDGLLHPDAAGRRASLEWWKRAFDVAAEVGAKVSGGPLGGMSVADASDPKRRDERYRDLLDAVEELSRSAKAAGLERLQVECTPLAREVPYTVEQARKFMEGPRRTLRGLRQAPGRHRPRPLPAVVRSESQHAGMAERLGPFHRRISSAEHGLPKRLALGMAG